MTPRQASYQFPWNLCSWLFGMSVTCWGERSASGAFNWATQRSPDLWVMHFKNCSPFNLKIECKHIIMCSSYSLCGCWLICSKLFFFKSIFSEIFQHIKVQKIIELTSMYSPLHNILFKEWILKILTSTELKCHLSSSPPSTSRRYH